MTEERVYEDEQLHDQFTFLLKDVETYLSPVTAELDAFLRLSVAVVGVATTVEKLGRTRNGVWEEYAPKPTTSFEGDNCRFGVVLPENCEIRTEICAFIPRDAMLARYMMSSCVCPSVCRSQACTVPKRLNVGSRKKRRMIA